MLEDISSTTLLAILFLLLVPVFEIGQAFDEIGEWTALVGTLYEECVSGGFPDVECHAAEHDACAFVSEGRIALTRRPAVDFGGGHATLSARRLPVVLAALSRVGRRKPAAQRG